MSKSKNQNPKSYLTHISHFFKGQLLVEVLIGIGIISMLSAAVIPLIVTSTNASSKEQSKMVASQLAKEGIEAAKAIKEEDWNNIYFPAGTSNKGSSNPYRVAISGSSWQLLAGQETITLNNVQYTREIIIENISRSAVNGAGEIETTYNVARDDPSTQKVIVNVSGFGSTPVSIYEYFSRWKNQIWNQTNWQGGAYSSITDIDASVAGTLQLARVGGDIAGNFGNRFLFQSATTPGAINNSNRRVSFRFKAQKTGEVNRLSVYVQSVNSGSSMTFRYGLQADYGGNPDGNYIADYGTASFSTTGWKSINLPSNVIVTAGSTYHLVIQFHSGLNPSGSRNISFRSSLPNNLLAPFSCSADSSANSLYYSGSWAIRDQQPLYLLGFSDGTYEGNPYDASAARPIWGNLREGEYFTLAQEKIISAISLYVSKNSNQDPADSLYVRLTNLSTGQVLVNPTVLVNGGDLTTTYEWKTLNLSGNLTLEAGDNFRLEFFSPASSGSRYYRVYSISNPNTADFNSSNWNGLNGKVSRSTDGGSNWTETDYVDLSGFNFNTVENPYAPFGELISTSLDAAKRAGFNRIFWNNLDAPAGTIVKFQLAANNDNTTWNFVGPGGTASDWYTTLAGENIWTGLANNRYLRYKARFETSNNTVTPVLDSVSVNWSP